MGNPFKAVGRYIQRVLLGIDQLGNTILGGAPDETISARVGRLREESKVADVVADVLDKIDKDHTAEAIRSEQIGRQQDKAYRDVYDPDDIKDVRQRKRAN